MAKTKKEREPGSYNPEMKWVRQIGPKLFLARPFVQAADLGTRYGQHVCLGSYPSRRLARQAAFKFMAQIGRMTRPECYLPKWVFEVKPEGFTFKIRIPVLKFRSDEVFETPKEAFLAAARMILLKQPISPTNYGGFRTVDDFRPVLWPDREWWDEVAVEVKERLPC